MDQNNEDINNKRELVNRRARQYYHRKGATDPEFIKYNNERNRNLIHKKRLEANEPAPKLGRPKKINSEPQPLQPKKRVGRHLKYPNETYTLEISFK